MIVRVSEQNQKPEHFQQSKGVFDYRQFQLICFICSVISFFIMV